MAARGVVYGRLRRGTPAPFHHGEAGPRTFQTQKRCPANKRVAARRRRAGSPAMPSLEDDEDAKAVKSSEGDIPPIVQKVTIA